MKLIAEESSIVNLAEEGSEDERLIDWERRRVQKGEGGDYGHGSCQTAHLYTTCPQPAVFGDAEMGLRLRGIIGPVVRLMTDSPANQALSIHSTCARLDVPSIQTPRDCVLAHLYTAAVGSFLSREAEIIESNWYCAEGGEFGVGAFSAAKISITNYDIALRTGYPGPWAGRGAVEFVELSVR
ncbi:hypothetical protein K432DRAFT_391229 [Lepidopterella palustris CBS 459.81]|uniref:Uncharacterized protein n=1 Tax=Lepidopterella palustris CBS 459.81 TaxID=1314670 RepID=A0A8E2EEB1_9PEZI|nr:hypothetical protein K432DRAFT_391229 [Lepidopterella palustris CBS 459.81]